MHYEVSLVSLWIRSVSKQSCRWLSQLHCLFGASSRFRSMLHITEFHLLELFLLCIRHRFSTCWEFLVNQSLKLHTALTLMKHHSCGAQFNIVDPLTVVSMDLVNELYKHNKRRTLQWEQKEGLAHFCEFRISIIERQIWNADENFTTVMTNID